ncbi:DeoR/GlpR family DNA-binding transcription regulator [Stutzerimonas chloritidismutans]|uniref:DeoR/GlpR family DNA-binding transcription regulator n=1 Tax=Stutzerimonas chloritidismutans TaxID=203192 RepID=UPI00278EC06D|nr:DeoR/GlpR family DNA-binding transcription regulator [Pseudomonas aeruginosa]HCF3016955.1 DeoR/GlpR transcriptional regulator [Pseudomonas aeruginosa]HCI1915969.1 DeoR/GlpR transcriptional regulator [Pseudomonas aeruginosa]
MLKVERQQRILALMQETNAVTVRDLAQAFSTSPITIRRDLLELGDKGLLERTHGGAVVSHEVLAEGSARYEMYSYADRHSQQAAEKAAIAECAAQYISDGDSILINAGTTAHALAHALRGHQDLHVITNGLTVAATAGQSQLAHVYVLAGRLDTRKQATIERSDTDMLAGIQIREAFLGVHAISAAGIFMRDSEDAAMNRAFIAAASRVTIMADHTKLKAYASFRICPWAPGHRLVTDPAADADVLAAISAQGV